MGPAPSRPRSAFVSADTLSALLLPGTLLGLLQLLDALRVSLLLCSLLTLVLLGSQLIPLLPGRLLNLLLFGEPQIALLHHELLLSLIMRLPGRFGVPLLLALIQAVFCLLLILLPLDLLLTVIF
jgi:hypothetical protein